MKIGKLEFAPSITGTLITLLLMMLFVKLGVWQLGRMEQKKVLSHNLQLRTTDNIIEFSHEEGEMINRDIDSFRFYPMQVTGSFLEDHDILLDNQIFEGKAGYHVLTPFLSKVSNTLILIDRGWIPWGEDRNELPEIPKVLGTVVVKGIINQFPAGLKLANQDEEEDIWPLRVQVVDYHALSDALKYPIFHFILKLQKDSPYGFAIGPIYFGLSSDRHLGYAMQWFTMALATFIYYLVIHLRRL